jgi:hypothetical protein
MMVAAPCCCGMQLRAVVLVRAHEDLPSSYTAGAFLLCPLSRRLRLRPNGRLSATCEPHKSVLW